jgi:hypothetical protein
MQHPSAYARTQCKGVLQNEQTETIQTRTTTLMPEAACTCRVYCRRLVAHLRVSAAMPLRSYTALCVQASAMTATTTFKLQH